jgi:methylamine dehydrogenase accessory protein MauD
MIMTVLIASVVLLYLLVCALAILVIVLYRQFGLIYVGSRRSLEMTGPPVGARAPEGLRVVSPDSDELSLALDWGVVHTDGVTLLLLGGEACPICEHLLSHLDDDVPPGFEDVRVLFVDKDPGSLPSTVPSSLTGRWQHWRSADGSVHSAFDVDVSPFAIVIDHEGIIRAKGIVSTRQAVKDLLREARLPGTAAPPGAATSDTYAPQ